MKYELERGGGVNFILHAHGGTVGVDVFCELEGGCILFEVTNQINVLYMPVFLSMGVLPYLGMVGRFRGDDPRLWDFRSDWVPIIYLSTIRLTSSFCRKSVCLYHI